MLHLVQTRPGLAKCIANVQQGDDVVFIGDGVICIQTIPHCRVFVQVEDANRCGVHIGEDQLPCSMATLVELVVQHDQSVSWR